MCTFDFQKKRKSKNIVVMYLLKSHHTASMESQNGLCLKKKSLFFFCRFKNFLFCFWIILSPTQSNIVREFGSRPSLFFIRHKGVRRIQLAIPENCINNLHIAETVCTLITCNYFCCCFFSLKNNLKIATLVMFDEKCFLCWMIWRNTFRVFLKEKKTLFVLHSPT